ELLVGSPAEGPRSFGDLQQRLNRKAVSPKMLAQYPAFARCYDLLVDGDDDLRTLPFTERRARLEAFVGKLDPARFDLSPLVPFAGFAALDAVRKSPPHPIIEGMML